MRSALCALGAAAALVLLPAAHARAEGQEPDRDFALRDARITESSGLAASRAHPGIYWTHNDQDAPLIYGVDSRTGETVATLTMQGVGTPRDMEAISVGPDGDIYVGDIGDNLDGSWDHVWIYRFPEPKVLKDQKVAAEQYVVKYADGPRDAEALMVHPKTGRVYIASKKQDGGGLYAGPERLSSSGTNVFRRVGEVPWVTDGAFSPDGGRLVLRGYFTAQEYVWKDGRIEGEGTAVGAPFQGQAESVTYTADGSALMFGSEGKNSRVLRVEPPSGGGGRETESPGAPASPGASASPSASAAPGPGEQGNVTVGFLVLAGATLLVVAGKRLVRRR
ncbi:WD40 repeat domain-containing protein [Streptomyces sp. NPDC090109]|uniref:WD40 repeat domain-containing protein n=1 Tax=unclassified Streptomyces TaxID=2593676 RepID=UPI000EF81075|nr:MULTISPECIES: WD40 repeat domain-containing protein [unclassified Streptomyces]MZE53435.1 WD40 repeat domain-containing protein [Streptomyces sp. SID5770]